MKKALWLLAICAVFVLAFSGAAYADTNSTFATWSTTGVSAANATTPTPHAGYSLTTVKCAVCHAVHKAPIQDAALNNTQILLATTAANACNFCHIQTNTGGIRLFGGDPTWQTTNSQHAHNNGCSQCHAVHGAGTIDATDNTIDNRILKQDPNGTGVQAGLPASWAYATGTHDAVISRFCTGCHPYYVGTYADGVGTNGQHAGSFGAGTYVGHVMTATVSANYHNSNGASAASVTGTVAATPDPFCRSCHDGGSTGQSPNGFTGSTNDNFPHYTLGLRFEKAAARFGAAAQDATTSAVQDGVCLKCHADAVGGVNKTF